MSATVAGGAAEGFEIIGAPLFAIRPLVWELPDVEQFDGLLIGSANAIRHGGALINQCRHLPVYAVGKATAELAIECGFHVALVGEGGLQNVLDSLAGERLHLLRITGVEHRPLSVPPSITLTERIAYTSEALPMPGELAGELAKGGIIMLHSGAAAQHFVKECNRLGVNRKLLYIAALAPRIAEAAGDGWAGRHCAAAPNEAALLELVGQLCHDLREG
nr:uroporphyrinogen-III synthase [Altericroceibacterium indicum]